MVTDLVCACVACVLAHSTAPRATAAAAALSAKRQYSAHGECVMRRCEWGLRGVLCLRLDRARCWCGRVKGGGRLVRGRRMEGLFFISLDLCDARDARREV